MDYLSLYFQTLYINEIHTHISKTEFVTSFLDVNMSDFYLFILKKYLFIPLLVLCIPILWGLALQCTLDISSYSWHSGLDILLNKAGSRETL
jgi:hypothetical protein